MKTTKRLGELLVEKGIITEQQLREALRLQVGGNRRLGYLLIKMGLLDSEQLYGVLSAQLDVPMVTIDRGIADEARKILPRYLCRKYSLLPLAIHDNKVLDCAMLDPLDDAAILDVENYTGFAVRPFFARQADITAAISSQIPFSLNDLFNQQVFNKMARTMSVLAIVFVIVSGIFFYNFIKQEKFGATSLIGEEKIYKNHDLMIGYQHNGVISLLGHGSYSDGYYSVKFDDINAFNTFMERKKDSFSEKQYAWIQYITTEEIIKR